MERIGKGLKRIIAIMCVGVVVLTLLKSDVYAMSNSTSKEDEIKAIMEEERHFYVDDPNFLKEASENGFTFEQFLEQKAERIYKQRNFQRAPIKFGGITQGVGNNGKNYFANISLIKQPDGNSCGPTSALQVLYGLGRQNTVSGKNDLEKIKTLSRETQMTSSTMVYKLVNALNMHVPSYGKYTYIQGKKMTLAQFQAKVQTSLAYDFAPILHARTEYIPYYKKHKSGHYIAITEIDMVKGTITVKDCNYSNKYYGIHKESIKAFYDSISCGGEARYLICLER